MNTKKIDDNNEPELGPMANDVIERVLKMIPKTGVIGDSSAQAVREQLLIARRLTEVNDRKIVEAENLLEQFQEAYQKLTAPANRLAVYLGSAGDGLALIAIGDTEYLCNIDPTFDAATLKVGSRVKVNDAYVVIGDTGQFPAGQIAKVQDVLDGGMLRVGTDPTGSQGRLVMRSDELKEAEIKTGDEVRMEPNNRVAVEHFPKQDTKDYYFEDVPNISWDKVGGQEKAIQLIRDTIELPLIYPELFEKFDKKPIKGILLYGPPGCGKTLIGKAAAYNLTREYSERMGKPVKEYFMFINGPKILNMWLGETERMIRDIFTTAREKAREGNLVFIFIDEAESILRTRSSGRWMNISNTVVPQFAAEMDGLVSMDNVVVMLTSNRPDYIDPAILRPERIDRKVKINRPDKAASKEILGIYLTKSIPLDPAAMEEHGNDLTATRQCVIDKASEFLWRTAPETEFLQVMLRNGNSETLYWKDLVSGALLKSVVDRAKDFAIRRAIESVNGTREHGITLTDLKNAITVEYKENEIFPKTDTQEDWLKLLDYDPENVMNIRPIRQDSRDNRDFKGII